MAGAVSSPCRETDMANAPRVMSITLRRRAKVSETRALTEKFAEVKGTDMPNVEALKDA